MTPEEALAREFEALRPQLVGAAYRVLGVLADAEDAVQEAWLRWADVDRGDVRDPRAYLLTVAHPARALNRLRQQRVRREDYVGPWAPGAHRDDARPGGTRPSSPTRSRWRCSSSLESLSPLERVAFVLHDVFGLTFDEVGTALERSPAAVRQLASRARHHVQARRPETVDRRRHDAVVRECLTALGAGDMQAFVAHLAPTSCSSATAAGSGAPALRPILGADKVGRWFAGVLGRPDRPGAPSGQLRELNGETAMVQYAGDELDSITFLTVGSEGVTAIHIVRNPEKLAHLGLVP